MAEQPNQVTEQVAAEQPATQQEPPWANLDPSWQWNNWLWFPRYELNWWWPPPLWGERQ
jgi:hypothetical protein